MATIRNILVVGATGKQGGAVINALLASSSSSSYKIFAPTRNLESPSARALAAKSSNIKLIKGGMEDAHTIFQQAGEQVDAMFAVTMPSMKKSEKDVEEIQGKALVDAALAHGVQHFVFTSVDRGSNSDTNPTDVPHFITKHNVEVHLKQKAAGKMTWTILRPVCFVDNFDPGLFGKLMSTWWAQMGNTKLKMVSSRDIGIFGAKALEDPQKYRNVAISLVGDELTFAEGNSIYKQLYGKDLPRTFGFIGRAFNWFVEDLGLMWKWFKDEGFGGSIEECRKINPEMQTFESWMKESSKHGAQ